MGDNQNYFKLIKEKLDRKGHICIFPMGVVGKALLGALRRYGVEVTCFGDHDQLKQGICFDGVECLSPEEILSRYGDDITVIVESLYYREIKRELEEKGLSSIIRIYSGKFFIEEELCRLKGDLDDKIDALLKIVEDDKSKYIVNRIVNAWKAADLSDDYFAPVTGTNQYFDNEVIRLSDQECFVDCGAYTGDTVRRFLDSTRGGVFEYMYLFELDSKICQKLNENINSLMSDQDRKQNIQCYPVGVADENKQISYLDGDSNSSISDAGECTGEVVRLDDVLMGKRVTFIKMDIEGSEYGALHGAKRLIKEQKPKLAICIYHSAEDLYRIPLYLKSIVPEYKIYIRHYTDLLCETVCYAVV